MPDDYVMLRTEVMQPVMLRLINAEMIVRRESDNALAIAWAANQHDQFLAAHA